MTTNETATELAPERHDEPIERVRERLAEVDERARSVIAAHPVAALICALGLGYVIGRVVTRL